MSNNLVTIFPSQPLTGRNFLKLSSYCLDLRQLLEKLSDKQCLSWFSQPSPAISEGSTRKLHLQLDLATKYILSSVFCFNFCVCVVFRRAKYPCLSQPRNHFHCSHHNNIVPKQNFLYQTDKNIGFWLEYSSFFTVSALGPCQYFQIFTFTSASSVILLSLETWACSHHLVCWHSFWKGFS